MNTNRFYNHTMIAIAILAFSMFVTSCEKSSLQENLNVNSTEHQRLDIGFSDLINSAQINVNVTPRSHGYVAEARGRGVIPSGEYAGQRFQISMEGNYSDIGFETLISGEVVVTIRGERFESVNDPFLQSFCCGEGHLQIFEGE